MQPSRLVWPHSVVRVIAAAILLQAAAEASWGLALGGAALIGFAVLRPRQALYFLAAAAPFLDWAWASLQMPPARVLDAAVLATLIGGWRGRADGDRDSWGPAHLLMLIIVLSAVARLAAVGAGLPLTDVLRDAAQYGRIFLTGAAHPFDIAGNVVSVAAGIALFIATRRIMLDRTHIEHLTTTMVMSGAIWATVALELYVFRPFFLSITHRTYRDVVLVADSNAAGSYFALLLFPAAVFTATRSPRGLWCMAVAALLGAFWLSWSSAAVLAAIVVLFAVLMTTARIARRTKMAIRLAAVLIVVAHLATRGLFDLDRSWVLRRDFIVTSVAMIRDEPLFGVGAGRYLELSAQYMPPALSSIYRRENAHNQYLQIGAEVGLMGLAVFAGLAWQSLRLRGPGTTPMALGIAAFLLSAVLGHPLLVTPIATLFWMALATIGATAAGSDGARRPATARGWLIGTVAVLVTFIVCFPARLRREFDRTVGTAAGVYTPERAPMLGPYRWSAGRVTLFPARDAASVRFGLRHYTRKTQLGPATVLVSGLQNTHVVTLRDQKIYCVEGPVHDTGLPFNRVDLWIQPVWYDETSPDRRTFGVQLMPAEDWQTATCPP